MHIVLHHLHSAENITIGQCQGVSFLLNYFRVYFRQLMTHCNIKILTGSFNIRSRCWTPGHIERQHYPSESYSSGEITSFFERCSCRSSSWRGSWSVIHFASNFSSYQVCWLSSSFSGVMFTEISRVQTIAICAGSGGKVLQGVDADLYFTGLWNAFLNKL